MSVVDAEETSVFLDAVTRIKENVSRVIRGTETEIEYLIAAVVAGESVLVQDVPGVGKTTLAKALASSLDLSFQRIQCTPDLMPADVFGVSIFNPRDSEFRFRKGPVFTNVLLVDEINRASPRTQSALLEAMAERQVTVEGKAWQLESPFVVIATQNPTGAHGTFPLPSSQLDRFAIRMSMDYPDRKAEMEILYRDSNDAAMSGLQPVLSRQEVDELQQKIGDIKFDKSLAGYLLDIVEKTRNHPEISLGCSPRGALSFFRCVQSMALIKGRDYVLPDDIQQLAPLALPHRLVVSNRYRQDSQSGAMALVHEIMSEIDVPV